MITSIAPDAEQKAQFQRILEARHHDPFETLGRHPINAEEEIIKKLLSLRDI